MLCTSKTWEVIKSNHILYLFTHYLYTKFIIMIYFYFYFYEIFGSVALNRYGDGSQIKTPPQNNCNFLLGLMQIESVLFLTLKRYM